MLQPPASARSRSSLGAWRSWVCVWAAAWLLVPAAWGQTADANRAPHAHRPATGPARCGDFLAMLHRKPAGLQWTGCSEGHLSQLRALVATYRVPGAQAAAVERYLARHTGMARLHFVCCGWEPRARGTQEGAGRLPGPAEAYRVDMASGETWVTRRGDWARIPWFEVRVTLPLESP